MKQEAREIIGKRLDRLNRYLHEEDGRFRAKNIHSFRLEVKKLRSFLKLFAVDGTTVRIPKRLKKLYRLLGKIRLIQLHTRAIREATDKFYTGMPAHYLVSLENETRNLKKAAKKYIRKMKPLRIKNFGKGLPEKTGAEGASKYFTRQENKLAALLHHPNPDGESLHEIRKILKGILYDLPYLGNKNLRGPEFNHVRKADLKSLESKLGKYHDVSISLQLLIKALEDSSEVRENHDLTVIMHHWRKENEELKKQITGLGLNFSKKIPKRPDYDIK